MSDHLLDLSLAVYKATDEWTYGASPAKVLTAETELRTALDATPASDDDHPVTAAARAVAAVNGFRFELPAGDADGAAETVWGDCIRTHLAATGEADRG